MQPVPSLDGYAFLPKRPPAGMGAAPEDPGYYLPWVAQKEEGKPHGFAFPVIPLVTSIAAALFVSRRWGVVGGAIALVGGYFASAALSGWAVASVGKRATDSTSGGGAK